MASVVSGAAAASKVVGMMTFGPFAFVAGVQGSKLYRNATSTDDDNKGNIVGVLRKEGVAARLMAGPSPPLAHWNKKYLEKHLRTNSAMRESADEIREVHRQAVGARYAK